MSLLSFPDRQRARLLTVLRRGLLGAGGSVQPWTFWARSVMTGGGKKLMRYWGSCRRRVNTLAMGAAPEGDRPRQLSAPSATECHRGAGDVVNPTKSPSQSGDDGARHIVFVDELRHGVKAQPIRGTWRRRRNSLIVFLTVGPTMLVAREDDGLDLRAGGIGQVVAMLSIWMASAICGNSGRAQRLVFGDQDVVAGMGRRDGTSRAPLAFYPVLPHRFMIFCEPTTFKSKALPADSPEVAGPSRVQTLPNSVVLEHVPDDGLCCSGRGGPDGHRAFGGNGVLQSR